MSNALGIIVGATPVVLLRKEPGGELATPARLHLHLVSMKRQKQPPHSAACPTGHAVPHARRHDGSKRRRG